MTFTLKIKTGNAAMRTGEDIAEALERVAASSDLFRCKPMPAGEKHAIHDVNGNTVGEWRVG